MRPWLPKMTVSAGSPSSARRPPPCRDRRHVANGAKSCVSTPLGMTVTFSGQRIEQGGRRARDADDATDHPRRGQTAVKSMQRSGQTGVAHVPQHRHARGQPQRGAHEVGGGAVAVDQGMRPDGPAPGAAPRSPSSCGRRCPPPATTAAAPAPRSPRATSAAARARRCSRPSRGRTTLRPPPLCFSGDRRSRPAAAAPPCGGSSAGPGTAAGLQGCGPDRRCGRCRSGTAPATADS